MGSNRVLHHFESDRLDHVKEEDEESGLDSSYHGETLDDSMTNKGMTKVVVKTSAKVHEADQERLVEP